MNYTENIIGKYRANGFKLTPQRLAILKCLDGNTSHPTAEDIYVEIKKTHRPSPLQRSTTPCNRSRTWERYLGLR